MVALLRHHGAQFVAGGSLAGRDEDGRVGPGRLRLVVDNTDSEDRRGAGLDRHRGVREVAASFDGLTAGLLVAAALVVFGGLLWVRAAQGGATADNWEDVGRIATEPALVVPADANVGAQDVHTVIARPGDTLWSVAQELSPESDPRPVVAALIEANGGDSVRIGQQIVIPGQLLD